VVATPPGVGYSGVMDMDTDPDGRGPAADVYPERGQKTRSLTRSLLLGSVGVGGVLAVLGLSLWLFRVPLVEVVAQSVLRGRGVDAELELQKLGTDGAHLARLRLGSADRPTVLAEDVHVSWTANLAAGLLEIRSLKVARASLEIAAGPDGVDLGALAPLLEGPAGPRRVSLSGIEVPGLDVLVATPHGPLRGVLSVRGGDTQGWTAGGLLRLPDAIAGTRSAPIPVGVHVRTGSPDGLVLAAGLRPRGLRLDFAALGFDGLVIEGVAGPADAVATFAPDGALTGRLTRLDLTAARIRAPGDADVRDVALTSPGFAWRQDGLWNTGSAFGGSLEVRAAGARFADLAAGPLRATLEPSRKANGKGALGLDLSVARPAMPGMSMGSVSARGALALTMPDLAAPEGWRIEGPLVLVARAVSVPEIAFPGLDGTRIGGEWDLRAPLVVGGGIRELEARLDGVLEAGSGSGSLAFVPSAARPSILSVSLPGATGDGVQAQATPDLRADAAGVLLVRQDGALARLDIASASWDGQSWTLDATLDEARGLRTAGQSVGVERLRVQLSGTGAAMPQGRAAGRITLSALPGASSAADGAIIDLDARSGAGGVMGLVASGTVSRLGAAAFQVTGSTFRIDGTARPQSGSGWQLAGDLRADAARLTASGTDARGLASRGRFEGALGSGGLSGTVQTSFGLARADGGAEISDAAGQYRGRLQAGPEGWSLDGVLEATAARAGASGSGLERLRIAGPLAATGSAGEARARFGLSGHAAGLSAPGLNGRDISAGINGDLVLSGPALDGTVATRFAAATLSAGETRVEGLSGSGPVRINGTDGTLVIGAPRCLAARIGSVRSGGASLSEVSADICPDSDGRLARFGPRGTALLAALEVSPASAVFAGGEDGDGGGLELGALRGQFRETSGGWRFEGSAPDLRLSVPLGAGRSGSIVSTKADVTVETTPAGLAVHGELGGLSAIGLPVEIAGSALADLSLGAAGLAGTFSFADLAVSDASDADLFGALRISGAGQITPGNVAMDAQIVEQRTATQVARARLDHALETGAGSLAVELEGLRFNPRYRNDTFQQGLQPADLVPPLRGILADGEGSLLGNARVAWQPGRPLAAEGMFAGAGLGFATAAGPVDGIAGVVSLTDLLNPTTNGPQEVRVAGFNPGVPINDGIVRFELRGDAAFHLLAAEWPFAGGTLSLRPTDIAYTGGEQRFTLDAREIDLDELMKLTELPNFVVRGTASGELPVIVRDGVAEIVGGRLRVNEGGGLIRYTGPDVTPPPPPPRNWWERQQRRWQGEPTPQGAGLAIAALRNFEYNVLELSVDGRVTGDLEIGIVLEGHNKELIGGAPFRFNIRARGPVARLLNQIGRLTNPQGYVDMYADEIRDAARQDGSAPQPPSVTPDGTSPSMPQSRSPSGTPVLVEPVAPASPPPLPLPSQSLPPAQPLPDPQG
jgi:hypothetical protein